MRYRAAKIAVTTLSALLIYLTGFCQDDCVETQREATAVREVRARSSVTFALQATSVPSLTDDVITLANEDRTDTLEAGIPNIGFYRVAPVVYELKQGKIVTENVELDIHREWLVAIDRGTAEIFLLEGSNDPVGQFNRLARRLRLRIADANAALGVFDFFLKVGRGQQFRSQVVGDEMKLESVALEDFRLRFSGPKRKRVFAAWWATVSATTKNSLLPPKASSVTDGFEIRYFFYTEGKLYKRTVTINKDGTISEGNARELVKAPRS